MISCDPTPASCGENIEPVTPAPDQVPPKGEASSSRLMSGSLTQNDLSGPAIIFTGSINVISAVAIFEHPFPSVYS